MTLTRLIDLFWRPRMGTVQFVLLYTAFSLLAFGGPLVERSLGFLPDKQGLDKLVYVAAMLAMVAFLELVLLFGLALLSRRLLKAVAILFLLVNSIAYYFISQYSIILDAGIILNVFATDQKTTTDLLHPAIALYFLGFGVIPSVLVARTELTRSRWKTLAALLVTALSYGEFTGVTFHTWLWIDKHLGTLGGVSLPWSYVFNSVILWRDARLANADKELLPLGEFTRDADRKQVVVLVIGETGRAANHAQYGYDRETNPYTKDLGLVALPNAEACSTYTLASLACILHHTGNATPLFAPTEALPSYLKRNNITSIWRTKSSGEGHIEVDEYITAAEIYNACETDCPAPQYDTVLLHGLAERIAATDSDRVFVALHQSNGSHGPSYFAQYPPEFARFTPVCDTVQIAQCDRDALINAYDNTIAYTDYMLAQTIAQLRTLDNTDAMMIYASDHGESLGENGVFLHGTPRMVAPREQFEVPILMWLSEGMKARHDFDAENISQDRVHGFDVIFHTVMGAFDLQSPIYRADQDLLAQP